MKVKVRLNPNIRLSEKWFEDEQIKNVEAEDAKLSYKSLQKRASDDADEDYSDSLYGLEKKLMKYFMRKRGGLRREGFPTGGEAIGESETD